MALKLGNCNNILKALHPDIYFIFIFSYLCGNDIVREDGLNATKMNSGYGIEKEKMHPTNINN